MNGIFNLATIRNAFGGLIWVASMTTHALDAQINHTHAELRLDERTPYFQLSSDRSVGDRGEEVIEITSPSEPCGERWVYDHADLNVLRNRFGDVQFVSLPESGCVDCKPIIIRWMHEPTGHLEFSVTVYRRQLHSSCEEDS